MTVPILFSLSERLCRNRETDGLRRGCVCVCQSLWLPIALDKHTPICTRRSFLLWCAIVAVNGRRLCVLLNAVGLLEVTPLLNAGRLLIFLQMVRRPPAPALVPL